MRRWRRRRLTQGSPRRTTPWASTTRSTSEGGGGRGGKGEREGHGGHGAGELRGGRTLATPLGPYYTQHKGGDMGQGL